MVVNYPILYSDNFESGVLDAWTAGTTTGVPPTLTITNVGVHAGVWALSVKEAKPNNVGYASQSVPFLLAQMALDGWVRRSTLSGPGDNPYSSLGIVDEAGNWLEMRDNAFAQPLNGLVYNGALQIAGTGAIAGFNEYRFEYDYETDSVTYYIGGLNKGTVIGLGFHEPAAIRCTSISGFANDEDVHFDDIVLEGNEIALWRRRREKFLGLW